MAEPETKPDKDMTSTIIIVIVLGLVLVAIWLYLSQKKKDDDEDDDDYIDDPFILPGNGDGGNGTITGPIREDSWHSTEFKNKHVWEFGEDRFVLTINAELLGRGHTLTRVEYRTKSGTWQRIYSGETNWSIWEFITLAPNVETNAIRFRGAQDWTHWEDRIDEVIARITYERR